MGKQILSNNVYSQICGRQSLADYLVVKQFLENTIDEIIYLQRSAIVPDNAVSAIITKLAMILLGLDRQYDRKDGWNCPGGIDAALASQFDLRDTTPVAVVGCYIGNVANTTIALLAYGDQNGVPTEAWLPQVQVTILEAALVLAGYDAQSREQILAKNNHGADRIAAG